MSGELRTRLQAGLGSAFTLERELGGGGMSRVFVATETALGRTVVVKVLPPELSGALSADRFRREIQLAAKLHHPHIVPVLASGEADGMLFYTMPFVEGDSLRSKLEREGELPIAESVRLIHDVADALAYAHAHGVVHRDLKPDNILMAGRHALVIDFGVAKAMYAASSDEDKDKGFTSAGVALGTPAYMAPEQAAADPQADHRVDLYALGIVAYEMLTGSHPFAGRRGQAMLAAHATETPEATTKRRPSVPPYLASIVERLLEKRPADRLSTGEQVVHELDAVTTPSEGSSTGARARDDAGSAQAYIVNGTTQRGQPSSRGAWKFGVLGGAIVGVGVVAAAVMLAAHRSAPVLEPKRVVVASFTNKSGDRSLDPLGVMAADWIARGLTRTGLVDVAGTSAELAARTGGSAQGATSGEGGLQALAEDARAGLVISGAYYKEGDSVLLEADFTDAASHRLLQSVGPIAAPVAAPLKGVELLRQRVTGSLASVLDPRLREVAGMTSEPPSFDAYSEFLQGDELFYSDDSAAVVHYFKAAALDSTYVFPLIRAISALTNRGETRVADSVSKSIGPRSAFLSTYEAAYLEFVRAEIRDDEPALYAGAHAMMRAAPKAEFPVYLAANEANGMNRPHEALELLDHLDPKSGALQGRIYFFAYYDHSLHSLGLYARELDKALEGRQQYPNRLYLVMYEMRALAALGRIPELKALLHEGAGMSPDLRVTPASLLTAAVYELRAHDRPTEATATADQLLAWIAARPSAESASNDARLERARALLAAHCWADAGALADSLVSEEPRISETLGMKALAAAERGDRALAERTVGALPKGTDARQQNLFEVWRATVFAALGDKSRSLAQLRLALPQAGRSDWDWHDEPIYELMRDYAPFQEYIKPKG